MVNKLTKDANKHKFYSVCDYFKTELNLFYND